MWRCWLAGVTGAAALGDAGSPPHQRTGRLDLCRRGVPGTAGAGNDPAQVAAATRPSARRFAHCPAGSGRVPRPRCGARPPAGQLPRHRTGRSLAAAREPAHLARRRSDYRRALRCAAQAGGVQTEIIAPQPAEVDSPLDLAMAIEARSWKGAAGTALLHDPQRALFLASLLGGPAGPELCESPFSASARCRPRCKWRSSKPVAGGY